MHEKSAQNFYCTEPMLKKDVVGTKRKIIKIYKKTLTDIKLENKPNNEIFFAENGWKWMWCAF